MEVWNLQEHLFGDKHGFIVGKVFVGGVMDATEGQLPTAAHKVSAQAKEGHDIEDHAQEGDSYHLQYESADQHHSGSPEV